MEDTLQVITDFDEFRLSIRNSVLKTYLLSFLKNPTFIEYYEETYLTDEMLNFWISKFIIKKESHYFIYDSQQVKLEKELYKDFVESIMGRLVDAGILSMCWDPIEDKVVWKKIELID